MKHNSTLIRKRTVRKLFFILFFPVFSFSQTLSIQSPVRYFDITPISRMGLTQPALVAGDGLHPSGLQYTEWVMLILDYIDSTFPTKISKFHGDEFFVLSPNPVKDLLRITSSNQMKKIEISSITGSVIIDLHCFSKNETILIRDFPPSVYMVKVLLTNGAVIVRKIIVQ